MFMGGKGYRGERRRGKATVMIPVSTHHDDRVLLSSSLEPQLVLFGTSHILYRVLM